ncbi:ABC transporter ATP-binding protein [Alicyclobacillus macrosporangiidus]|uniref:ABC-2 type transport system ATP-binding protein n=1 Tax=Alicyclobacillus macrosporangiidus TaxID=392015 RepID=A0A1I7LH23_9BACL|nr:ABC transporter ATP-binding protein [Alicyclobacillus macrosporangiidus]SFV08936.1 ABC-2 type transport system ATP-binding protein [Alicyclobacillus macrosporangiidus]
MFGKGSREEGWGIQVSHVDRKFGKRLVLQDIDFEVKPAEIFGLLGPSGSGKTTLVKLMAGIDRPTSGTVVVGGVQMPRLDMLGKIGYMAQSDALYAELTAKENLDFFASLFGLRGRGRRRRIEEVMELVHLTDSMKKRVSTYSGGMKRRLSLAIAMLHRPRILILDEPTVGIDPALRVSIWNELRDMSQSGTTILVTTHVMDEAEKCHRLGMLRDGRLIAVGTPGELKASANVTTIEEAFLAFGGVRG